MKFNTVLYRKTALTQLNQIEESLSWEKDLPLILQLNQQTWTIMEYTRFQLLTTRQVKEGFIYHMRFIKQVFRIVLNN